MTLADPSAPPRWQRLLQYERALWESGARYVCGVDEVGVGPLAGPVVAAAVVLPPNIGDTLTHLDDSKKVTAKRRGPLADAIVAHAIAWAVAAVDVKDIDRLNIFAAAREASKRAIDKVQAKLCAPIDSLLLDAHPLACLPYHQQAIIKGDAKSQSIAAASIVAKVARDRYMQQLAARHPGYGFEQHMGYPTPKHLAALRALGPSPVHRRSFAPVTRALLQHGAQAKQREQRAGDAHEDARHQSPRRDAVSHVEPLS